jgi:hypothetical protein
MPVTRHVSPRPGDVLILVGTMKGAFIVRSDARRQEWDVGGPYFPGSAVYATAFDARAGRHRVWAGPHSMHWGGLLRSSDDFGKTWTNPEQANVKFPESSGAALAQIWQIVPGRESEPDTLYCGVSPRRSSSRATRGRRGRSPRDSGITPIVRSGSRAAAGCAFTPSFPIRSGPTGCASRSPPPACT